MSIRANPFDAEPRVKHPGHAVQSPRTMATASKPTGPAPSKLRPFVVVRLPKGRSPSGSARVAIVWLRDSDAQFARSVLSHFGDVLATYWVDSFEAAAGRWACDVPRAFGRPLYVVDEFGIV